MTFSNKAAKLQTQLVLANTHFLTNQDITNHDQKNK